MLLYGYHFDACVRLFCCPLFAAAAVIFFTANSGTTLAVFRHLFAVWWRILAVFGVPVAVRQPSYSIVLI
jgi:hypothetical protein